MNVLRSAVVACLFAAGLVAMLPVGAPVSVSYVYSGSMEPTLSPGDGYVLHSTNDVEAGDVVTFWSDSNDEYVTHRVVDITERGLVTKGDANDRTDQASGHAYVDRDAVVGEAVTVDGSVVAIPAFGTLVEMLRTHRGPLFGGAVAVSVLSTFAGRSGRGGRSRLGVPGVSARRGGRSNRGQSGHGERGRRLRVGHLYVGAFVLATAVVTALFVTTATVHRWEFVATIHGNGMAPPVGETAPFEERLARPSSAVVDSFVHVSGLDDATVTNTRTEHAVAGTVPARSTPGVQYVEATVYRHPAVLPDGVLASLRGVHPLVAVTGSVAVALSVPFAVASTAADLRRPLRLPRRLARRR